MWRKIVLALGVSLALMPAARGMDFCDEGEWDCRSVVHRRDGVNDFFRCPQRGFSTVACFLEVTDTCVEKETGKKVVKNYRQFTGACVQNIGDCW